MEEDFLCHIFQQTCKGSLEIYEYLSMKMHVDQPWSSKESSSQRALIPKILLGLDEEFNLVIATI